MKKNPNHELSNILQRDPVAEVEDAVGRKVRDPNDPAAMLLLAHAFATNAVKRAALEGNDDIHFNTKLPDYRRIIESLGFRKVLEVPFKGSKEHQPVSGDTLFIYFRDDGILLKFETWNGETINSGKYSYNWKQKKDIPPGLWVTSSSSWRLPVTIPDRPPLAFEVYDAAHAGDSEAKKVIAEREAWNRENMVMAGDHDCREAVRYHIALLEEYGQFVTPWVHSPWLWLLHYGDNADNYKAINEERIAMLPPDVRKAINL